MQVLSRDEVLPRHASASVHQQGGSKALSCLCRSCPQCNTVPSAYHQVEVFDQQVIFLKTEGDGLCHEKLLTGKRRCIEGEIKCLASVSFSRRSCLCSAFMRDCTAFALFACALKRLMNCSTSLRFFSSLILVFSCTSSSSSIWSKSFCVGPVSSLIYSDG